MISSLTGTLTGAIAISRAAFGEGTGPIHLDNMECTGNEETLADCPHQGLSVHNCGHGEDAGVYCQRKTALYTSLLATTLFASTMLS